MSAREIIHHSDELTVVLSESGSDTVVVTFNEMGTVAAGDAFWGATLLETMGVTAIGFVTARPNWYPLLATMAGLDAALARIAGRRVITYGYSQGGYGALKFGGRLGAEITLAFSPQWSINPDDVRGFDDRFMSHHLPLLRNGERVEQDEIGKRNFVFLDRASPPDNGNALRLAALQRVELIPAPFTGHDSIRLVTEGRVGRRLLDLCVSGTDVGAPELRRLLRSGRRRSSTYAARKMDRLQDSAARHGKFLFRVISEMDAGTGRTLATAQYHAAMGEIDMAETALATLSDDDLATTDLHAKWLPFRRTNFRYGESRLAQLFPKLYPDNLWIRLHGVDSLLNLGHEEAALAELETLSGFPGAAAHLQHFLQFYSRLDRLELASDFTRRLAQNDATGREEAIRLAFEVAEAMAARGMRSALFRELQHLDDLCSGAAAHSVRLSDLYRRIGENAFARRALERVSAAAPGQAIVSVALLEFEHADDAGTTLQALHTLAARTEPDPAFWLRLSQLAETLDDPALALKAAKTALPLHSGYEARYRVAQLLTRGGEHQAALAELRGLSDLGAGRSYLADQVADLAAQCGDLTLGTGILDEWLRTHGHNTHIYSVRYALMARAGRDAEAVAAIDHLLELAANGMAVSHQQFTVMLQTARGLDLDLVQRVGAAAFRWFPDDAEFRMIARPDPFAAKFYGNAKPGIRPPPTPRKFLGLFRRRV